MKILRIYYNLPPKKGGMEKHIFHLTQYQNIDHEAAVFFNVGHKITDLDVQIMPAVKFYKIKPLFVGIFAFYSLIILKLLFKKYKADVVHVHGDWSSLVFAKAIKKLVRARVVVFSYHGQITGSYSHTKLLPRFSKNADLIFTTGYDAGNIMKEISGRPVVIQPSGINEIYFAPHSKKKNNQKFKVITVANLFPVKNIKLIFEIAEQMKDVDFVVVGDGIEMQSLQEHICKKGVQNVDLPGFKKPDELLNIYADSDCFLLTSYAEGTPTSALEALAFGLPIVSSNAGGLGNIIINGVNGYIINTFEPADYIEKIRLLQKQPDKRNALNVNNKMLSEQYKWNIVAKNITNDTFNAFTRSND